MRKILDKLFARECDHPQTVSNTTSGIRRIMCTSCGHLSFTIRHTVGV